MLGLVFDIDDTLYCRQDMLVKAAETVLGTNVDDPLHFIKVFYDKSDINMKDLESGKITTREINGWRYEETFKALSLPFKDGDGVLSADAYLELQSHMALSEDMIDTLIALSDDPGIRLAVLTAGESEHQRHKVEMVRPRECDSLRRDRLLEARCQVVPHSRNETGTKAQQSLDDWRLV